MVRLNRQTFGALNQATRSRQQKDDVAILRMGLRPVRQNFPRPGRVELFDLGEHQDPDVLQVISHERMVSLRSHDGSSPFTGERSSNGHRGLAPMSLGHGFWIGTPTPSRGPGLRPSAPGLPPWGGPEGLAPGQRLMSTGDTAS